MKKTVPLLLLLIYLFPACKKSDNAPTVADAKTILNVSYGSAQNQNMDVYLPPNRSAKTPVVIVLHGGGFIGGDKSDFTIQSQMLMAKGYAVLNLNYRLVDTAGLLQLPPLHRASAVTNSSQVADIKAALDYAAAKAAEWVMRAGKWGICGHSAGGTLALLTAYNYGAANTNHLLSVVANWAGATDLSFTDESQFLLLDPRLTELYYRAVGAEPRNANKLAYMAVSPIWIAFNGNGISTINIRPQFNDTGMGDGSYALYEAFTNTLKSKGVPNKWVEVAGADHGFGQPGNWDLVINETSGWFEKYLR